MDFISLPAEIKLVIAEQLDPKSCLKFASACKGFFDLCASLIAQHKHFWLRYNTLETKGAERLIWDVTREIVEDPRRAYHVEDISLPSDRQQTWDPDGELDMFMLQNPDVVPEELVQLYTSAAKQHPILRTILEEKQYDAHFYGTNGVSTWNMEQTIRKGDDWPIVTILCALAPNIRILRFTDGHSSWESEFFDMLKRVASAYADPIQNHSLPFQHLTHVAIAHYDTEMCCDAQWAKLFLALPSLKGFATYMMGGNLDSYSRGEAMPKLAQSNVKDILLGYSYFTPEAVEGILSGIKALESFGYECGGAIVSDEGSFAPRRVVAALVKYAGHSLERLILSGDGYDDYMEESDISHISLSGFQKLKHLHCDFSLLMADPDEDSDMDEELPDGGFYTEDSMDPTKSLDFSKSLPHSLEALHLDGDAKDTEWVALAGLLEESELHLPNLKQVWYNRTSYHEKNAKWNHVERMLERKGIKYEPLPDVVRSPLFELLKGQQDIE